MFIKRKRKHAQKKKVEFESDEEELTYDRKPPAPKYTEADIDARINSKLEEIQKKKSEDETLKLIRAMIPDFGK